jgi:hypothetical protein
VPPAPFFYTPIPCFLPRTSQASHNLSKQTDRSAVAPGRRGRPRRRKRRSHARAPRGGGGHGDRERRRARRATAHAETGGARPRYSTRHVTPWGPRVKAVPHPILQAIARSHPRLPPHSNNDEVEAGACRGRTTARSRAGARHGCCGRAACFAFAGDKLMAGPHPVDRKRGRRAFRHNRPVARSPPQSPACIPVPSTTTKCSTNSRTRTRLAGTLM